MLFFSWASSVQLCQINGDHLILFFDLFFDPLIILKWGYSDIGKVAEYFKDPRTSETDIQALQDYFANPFKLVVIVTTGVIRYCIYTYAYELISLLPIVRCFGVLAACCYACSLRTRSVFDRFTWLWLVFIYPIISLQGMFWVFFLSSFVLYFCTQMYIFVPLWRLWIPSFWIPIIWICLGFSLAYYYSLSLVGCYIYYYTSSMCVNYVLSKCK